MSRKIFVTDDMGLDEALIDIAATNPEAAMLWPWLLPYFDDWGRADASPRRIKGKIFPLFEHITPAAIEAALKHFADAKIITLYEVDGARYMCIDPVKWFAYQTHIHREKRITDGSRIPACSLFTPLNTANARETDSPPAQSRAIPRDSAQSRASPSPSPSPSPSQTREESTTTRDDQGASAPVVSFSKGKKTIITEPDPFANQTEEDAAIHQLLATHPHWESEARRRSEGKQNPQAYFNACVLNWSRGEWAPPAAPVPVEPVRYVHFDHEANDRRNDEIIARFEAERKARNALVAAEMAREAAEIAREAGMPTRVETIATQVETIAT